MIKVGVIGCGTIANAAHIPSYMKNADVEIKYFCDIIPERAQAAVEKYGCGVAVTNYHDVINDPEIDAISVCTPNRMHPVITIDALRAGKNVLCEKPAARTYAEVEQMVQAQRETGKILVIGVVNRFNDSVRKIKQYIDEGRLGTVHHVYVSFRQHRSIPGLGGAFTTKEIAGGGVLIDWGVHYLDIVMYCCGDPKAVTVSGETFSKLGRDIKGYTYRKMWAGPPKLDGAQGGGTDPYRFRAGLHPGAGGGVRRPDGVRQSGGCPCQGPGAHRGPSHHPERRLGAEH